MSSCTVRMLCALLAPAMLVGGAAAAQDREDAAADEEARMRFEAGNLAYQQGRYESALNDFRQAYELSQRPALLFNIGAAAQNLRRDQEALDAFEAYLRELPTAQNRAAVEARIAILRRALDEEAREPDEREEPSEAPAAAASTSPSALSIGLLAGGGTLALAGAILIGVGQADYATVADASRGTSWSDVAGAYERAEPLSIAGISGLGAGLATAIVGLVLFFVAPDHEPSERAGLSAPFAWRFEL